jgi:Fic family protein
LIELCAEMLLLDPKHLNAYRADLAVDIDAAVAELTVAVNGGAGDMLSLYESAVASSQIEGSKVTLEIFRRTMAAPSDTPKPRDVQEVADLVSAYQFAQRHPINKANLLEAHRIASALLVNENDRGAWRTKGVKVGNALITVYMAAHQSQVPKLMDQLLAEIDALLQHKLSVVEAFYYASLLHLAFVKIHPFIDGNGRTGRLLEKWFLAHHIGPIAWSVRSERYLIRNLDDYYDTLAALGPEWGSLQWDRCVPFLLLLPQALVMKR